MQSRRSVPLGTTGSAHTKRTVGAATFLLLAGGLAACGEATTAPLAPEPAPIEAVGYAVDPVVAPQTNIPIAYGNLKSDSIAVLGEVDQLPFTGAQNDVVLVRIGNAGAISGCWNATLRVFSPSSVLLASVTAGCNGATGLTLTLPASGTFTIQVSDHASDGRGRYNITLQRLSNPTGIAIGYAGLKSDTIGRIVEMNGFVFTGVQGQVALLRAGNTGAISGCWNAVIDLYDKSGVLVQSAAAGCNGAVGMTVTLPSSGTYLILMSDHASDGRGSYNLTLQRLSGPTGIELGNGDLRSGSVAKIVQMRRYIFTGTQGDVVLLRSGNAGAISGCWNAVIDVYSQAGALVKSVAAGCNGAAGMTLTLPATGKYLVLVSDHASDGRGNFNITLHWLSKHTGTAIGYSGLKSDSVGKIVELRRFQFNGAQGNVVLLRAGNTGAISGCWNAVIDLYDQAGALVQSAAAGCNGAAGMTLTLPSSGTYLVLISDHASDGRGRFNFTLQRLSNPTGIELGNGDLRRDSVAKIVQMRRYIFTGTQGNVVLLRSGNAGAISGCWNAVIDVYSQAGALVKSAAAGCNGASGMTLTLPATGKYLVLVSDHASDGRGRFNITLHWLSNHTGTAITYGQVRSGSIGQIAELDRFVFTGSQNDAITLTAANTGAISGCWNAVIDLYDQAGALVQSVAAGCNGSPTMSRLLPASGTYLILISDHASDGRGNYNLSITSP